MTTIEQIENLKKQIVELEKKYQEELEEESNESNQIKFIRSEGKRKIDELINGYEEKTADGDMYITLPIDWEFCQTIGEYAKENYDCDGDMYIWPYKNVEELINDAEDLLNDALNKCIKIAKGGIDGVEYDDCFSYYVNTKCGRFLCWCSINLPKDPDATSFDDGTQLVRFGAHVELDGMCEW